MPTRSRASQSARVRGSKIAKANWPMKSFTQSMPFDTYDARTTSVSEVVRNA